MRDKKYLVVPGPVFSKHDGDLHHISAKQLMKLYGVDPKDCDIYNSTTDKITNRDYDAILRVSYEGDYTI